MAQTDSTRRPGKVMADSTHNLNEVVITGQYEPQSLKNSVYMVRTITSEQIRLRSATKVQEVLSDQLGVLFSYDPALGTSDVSLMGVSGQRLKILLDGVPLFDRNDARESLNQIDVNNVDRIEIVEGPMSVSYGSDALGGVINIITKKSITGETLRAYGRVQEETAGKKYNGFKGSGAHLANVGLNWEYKGFELGGSVTRNNFDAALPNWLPKEQTLGNIVAGYRTNNLHVWYRLDGTDETLISDGIPNQALTRTDKKYISNRWMHQVQVDWRASGRLSFAAAASYTDYSRRTQTSSFNMVTGERHLTFGQGEQDTARFDSKFFRATAQYKLSNTVTLQPGVEATLSSADGQRIKGSPSINDYAFFLSSEINVTPKISLRPGVRFIKNSVYDAPPVIPALNAKFVLSPTLDLRLAYARGFRSPALRELYFDFQDASHAIFGNENLKAEYSDSFNGSLSWQTFTVGNVKVRSTLGGFFSSFHDFIAFGSDPNDVSRTVYVNIDKYKTAGATLENTLFYKSLQAKVGFSYIGVYNRIQGVELTVGNPSWYPEVNTNLMYHFTKLKADISVFYKFNGALPMYTSTDGENIRIAKRDAFHTADVTLNKVITRNINLAGGVKNLFDITNINSTAGGGGAHGGGSSVIMGYGRSFFLGLNFQFSKK
ncbi:MAG: TonB-dependent receptor [Sphingobacteriaceae bacterium]|nr:MAG: TonB-dependent receptor [Sphingobacteriaceae bacterium]